MTRVVLSSMLPRLATALFLLGFGPAAFSQEPPFFGGGGAVGFDPEISVVNSGALTDVQVVVSHDRRYVTINSRVSLTHLNSLQTFDVVRTTQINAGGGGGGGGGRTGGGVSFGYVGGAGFIDDEELVEQPAGAQRSAAPVHAGRSHVNTSPSAILQTTPIAADSLLRRQGMFLLAPPRAPTD